MKKVCFFMNTPFNLGGEQRIVTVLANYLVNNNYEVYFMLTNSNHEINRKIYNMDDKIKIIFVKEYNKLSFKLKRKILSKLSLFNSKSGLLKNNLSILKKFYCIESEYNIFKNYFDNYNFDYVIGIGNYYFGKLALLKEKLAFNAKIVAWEHNCFKAYFETKGLRFFNQYKFVRHILNIFDFYIVQTDDDYKKMNEIFNYKPLKINNSNTFSTCKKSDLKKKNFIAAGRFSNVKNFLFLIDCFKKFNEINNEWNLYIYGDGEQYKECLEKVKHYGLDDKIHLPGKTSNMEEKYINSSVYLLSSLWEGWGMVVTEAMQYGLPVVSTDIPSTREIFGKTECGKIVSDFSTTAFSNAMIEIVNNCEYKRISKVCLERVKNFDIEIIGEKWKEILK